MREIGGYFGLEPLNGEEYYKDLIAVNNARNGLLYLLQARKIRKMYLPYFLCNSVSEVCDRGGSPYEYYNIGEDFLPVFEKKLEEGEYLYVVNYYGQLSNETVVELKTRYTNIILDNVQAFFQRPCAGVDTLYSCRKFFGVPDGGYVSTNVALSKDLPTDISMDRMMHILGRFEGKRASDYYLDFQANESSFVGLELRLMSELTHNLMKAIDYQAVRGKREENFAFLDSQLSSRNCLKPKRTVGPYAYPLYCDNGMEIKKRMAEKKIYIPTLWPEIVQSGQTLETSFAENILPLPCDQRYDIDDMDRIVRELTGLM